MLLGRNPVFAGDRFSASYFETDFASFLAWRDWGFPDPAVFNGFGMGALRCADGAFVLGEMGQHTSNAGRIYFPSGTPDLDDIRDGTVDISGSVARELEEETGLAPPTIAATRIGTASPPGTAVAMIRILRVDMPGEALRGRIEGNLALQRSARIVGNSSRARHARPQFGNAAFCHGLHRGAVRVPTLTCRLRRTSKRPARCGRKQCA